MYTYMWIMHDYIYISETEVYQLNKIVILLQIILINVCSI